LPEHPEQVRHDYRRATRPRIAYLDGQRLRRALLAGIEHVSRQRAELDRINVFPVPDGDTGTNLALTLTSVAEALHPVDSRSVSEVAGVAAEASVMGARGNSGMLISNFLLVFARSLGRRIRAGTSEIAEALTAAAASLHQVLESPREGTIITVAREMAAEANRRARLRPDLYPWLRDVQACAWRSLRRTRELLPALREAGVVDAGAKGFVALFDGVLHYVEGRAEAPLDAPRPTAGPALPSLYVAREAGVGADEGRYCTQVAVRAPELHADSEIRAVLAGLGTSTIILRAGALAKVHIHANDPERVVMALAGLGEIVSERVEDTMLVGAGRHVAVITDSSADLPHDWVERHGVSVVPLQVIVGDETYRDGVDLDADKLLEILTAPGAPPLKTSLPSPSAFESRCREALARGGEGLLGVFVSSVLSGTYSSGVAAIRRFEGVPAEAVDSRSASLGVGLLIARAVELLDDGMELAEVAGELRRICHRSNVFLAVDTLEYVLRSGRVGRAKAWVGGLLGYKPILTIGDDGRIVPAAKVRGREALAPRVLSLLDAALAGANRYRLGVAHFAAPDVARQLVAEIEARYTPVEILSGPTTAALAVHMGPGAWTVAYQVED
jgi:DegV family protein with EDD domain